MSSNGLINYVEERIRREVILAGYSEPHVFHLREDFGHILAEVTARYRGSKVHLRTVLPLGEVTVREVPSE